jgi:hypothetical protein
MKNEKDGLSQEEQDRVIVNWETEALSRNLESLAGYCNEEGITRWPSDDALSIIGNRVRNILRRTRQRVLRGLYGDLLPPPWKAFQTLDRRIPFLKLVQRVDNLVKRAKARLSEGKEPSLFMLYEQAIEGKKEAENLSHDIGLVLQKLDAARDIDWAKHEKTLVQFSPTHSVELSCKQSALPLPVRCYGRVLELIVEAESPWDLQEKSSPLKRWIAEIGHPGAGDLQKFDKLAAHVMEHLERGKTHRKRELGRERVRRYRAKNSLTEKRYTEPL